MNKKGIVFLILGLSIIGVYFIYTIFFYMNNEVMQSFDVLNERLHESNQAIIGQNIGIREDVIEGLDDASRRKITQIDSLSHDLFKVMDDLRNEIIPNLDTHQDYSKYDALSDATSVLFKNNAEEGQKLVVAIDTYREGVIEILNSEYPEVVRVINSKFNTDAIVNENKEQSWLEYHFKDFPIIAVATKLTQLQSDIVHVKGVVFNEIVH
jgi:hypothetical protein